MKPKAKNQPDLHILTDKVSMKFAPKCTEEHPVSKSVIVQPTQSTKSSGIFSWLSGRSAISQANSLANSMVQAPATSSADTKVEKEKSGKEDVKKKLLKDVPEDMRNSPLKFLERISPQHILIGNQKQLDIINVAGISPSNFVDTEYIRPIHHSEEIKLVNVDKKKFNLLALVAGRNLEVYKYDFKKFTDTFKSFKTVKLEHEPLKMQIVKDGNICLFYEDRMQVYSVSDIVRRKYAKKYQIPEFEEENTEYKILTVPSSYDNVLNVFFEQNKPSRPKVFTLWSLEFQFLATQIKSYPPHKVYEIKKSFKKTLQLYNYSKQIFFMNLGSEILALKKGYVLDSATVNLKSEESRLVYVGKQTLFHISSKKIEVYNFQLNMTVKPYRIQVSARDSIKIYDELESQNQQFFNVVDILNNDYAFFFQTMPRKNRLKKGQILYSFYVTRSIKRQQKINQLFPKVGQAIETYKVDDPRLLEKCDMAEKMGLTVREIYLQLWNRSTQDKQNDYSLLISTKDYNTIKEEVIRKLRKKAMNFKQIKNIEDACYAMLQQRVYGTSCTEQAVMEFITSHFLKRKLQMFKDIYVMDKQIRQIEEKKAEQERIRLEKQEAQRKALQQLNNPKKKKKLNKAEGNEQKEEQKQKKQQKKAEKIEFKMTIRQYQNYKSMQIKDELISLISQFCHDDKKQLSKNIRFLLRNFKFVFRIIYYELLDQIIKTANVKLLVLLKEIPQLLPYTPQEEQKPSYIPAGYYQGVWTQINNRQWDHSLYVDAITTIDNKQIVLEKVIKSLGFRRNWLSLHDMVTESREGIIKNYEKIKSAHTFFFFISKVFHHIKQSQILKQVMNYLEQTYEIIPEKIRRKIFLLHKIYSLFEEKNIVPIVGNHLISFSEFLNYEDYELIKHCFDKERSMKGLILKDIKKIYSEEVEKQGDTLFNQAILNYFISDLSSVSDLKYILNRINNEKMEFHQANQEMYEILVEAIERKLKLGSDNDIPIEEVIIYIENIPIISKDLKNGESKDPIKPLLELKTVEKLNKQAVLLKRAKINMSLYDILRNPEEVFTKLVNHAVAQNNIRQWAEDTEQNNALFDNFTYENNAEIQGYSEQIYEKSNAYTIFFIFLSKICEETGLIRQANRLLQNQHLKDTCFDDTTAEGLVQYMYKWKLSNSKTIINNQRYIKQLLKLLPEESTTYNYISAELQFAQILSNYDSPVEYPISEGVLNIKDIKAIINDLPYQFVMEINMSALHRCIIKMQEIIADQFADDLQENQFGPANFITLHQLYEIVIVKLMNAGKLRDSLLYIRKILQLEINETTYNIIYPVLFIIHLSAEINQLNKNNLIQCAFYYFYDPWKLLQVLQYVSNTPLNPRQMKQYIQHALEKGKELHKGYNSANKVFNAIYLENITQKDQEINFMKTLVKTTKRMLQAKQQFKNIKYAAIMAMLCNSPFALAKYISSTGQKNIKSIRSFMSYLIKEEVFDDFSLLELGRRIFIILLLTEKQQLPIEVLIQQYSEESLQSEMDIDVEVTEDKQSFEYQMWKSAEAFKKKKQSLQTDKKSRQMHSRSESVAEKSKRIRDQLHKVPNIQEMAPSEYPFDDSDNEGDLDFDTKNTPKKSKKLMSFDAKEQMKNALSLKEKKGSGMLFMSSRGDINHKNPIHLSVSISKPNRCSFGTIQTGKVQKRPSLQNRSDQKLIIVEKLQQSQDFNDDEYLNDIGSPISHRNSFLRQQLESNSNQQKSHASSPNIQGQVVKEEDAIIQHKQAQDQLIQSPCLVMGTPDVDKQNSIHSGVSNPYYIKVNEVQDIEDDANIVVDLANSNQFSPPIQIIANDVVENNKALLERHGGSFDLSGLQKYAQDTEILKDVMIQIFVATSDHPNVSRVFELLANIPIQYPECKVEKASLDLISKMRVIHSQRLKDIPFSDIFNAQCLIQTVTSQDEALEKIYSGLIRNSNMENILKIEKFVEKLVGSSKHKERIYWDFILSLPQKMDNQMYDKQHTIEQVKYGCLPKVEIKLMNENFSEFEKKVLNSKSKNEFVELLCKFVPRKEPKSEAIEFLTKLSGVDDNPKIMESLKILMNS